ncbi:MAG: GGDEF domain-containing protein [Acidobacteria bacterium]|nr:GGDEF domain-containing protein [Acidobacteriota bacterium]
MANNAVISLDIRRRGHESDHTLVVRLLDEVLAWARDFLAADEDAAWGSLAARFEACRTAVAAGAPTTDVEALAKACLTEGRELIERLQQLRTQRVEDSFAVVEALRDVMATMGAEMTTMHTSLTQSSERFEAIGQLNDARQMKVRLMAEVLTLKQVAAKRRKAWEETARTLTQRVAALEKDLSTVKDEAATDSLTGIANRRGFDATLARWLAQSRPNFVLAVLDIDDFKGINDTHGHAVGDDVLRYVAQCLLQSFRSDDLVARVGGDEFAVLAAGLTARQAESRLAGVLSRISGTAAGVEGRPPCVPTVSCGLSECAAGDTAASLYERADDAQYTAKRQGKNRVVAKNARLLRDLARH